MSCALIVSRWVTLWCLEEVSVDKYMPQWIGLLTLVVLAGAAISAYAIGAIELAAALGGAAAGTALPNPVARRPE